MGLIAIKYQEQMELNTLGKAIYLGQGQSDIKPTTKGPCCHRPSLLDHDRWIMGVKGGASTAYTALS